MLPFRCKLLRNLCSSDDHQICTYYWQEIERLPTSLKSNGARHWTTAIRATASDNCLMFALSAVACDLQNVGWVVLDIDKMIACFDVAMSLMALTMDLNFARMQDAFVL